jgi:hypothetical protein
MGKGSNFVLRGWEGYLGSSRPNSTLSAWIIGCKRHAALYWSFCCCKTKQASS